MGGNDADMVVGCWAVVGVEKEVLCEGCGIPMDKERRCGAGEVLEFGWEMLATYVVKRRCAITGLVRSSEALVDWSCRGDVQLRTRPDDWSLWVKIGVWWGDVRELI